MKDLDTAKRNYHKFLDQKYPDRCVSDPKFYAARDWYLYLASQYA